MNASEVDLAELVKLIVLLFQHLHGIGFAFLLRHIVKDVLECTWVLPCHTQECDVPDLDPDLDLDAHLLSSLSSLA